MMSERGMLPADRPSKNARGASGVGSRPPGRFAAAQRCASLLGLLTAAVAVLSGCGTGISDDELTSRYRLPPRIPRW